MYDSFFFFLNLRMNNKCLERVNDQNFWNPGIFSYAMIPATSPTEEFFFFIVTSIVYAINKVTARRSLLFSLNFHPR
jgi:hypothetical protein